MYHCQILFRLKHRIYSLNDLSISPWYYLQPIKSQLRRQQRRYLLSLPPKGGYNIMPYLPILQTKPPLGGGASCVHVLTSRHASFLISVSISKYFYPSILYLICFIMFQLIRLYLQYTLFISYHPLFIRLILFLLCVYFYSQYSYPQLHLLFNIII